MPQSHKVKFKSTYTGGQYLSMREAGCVVIRYDFCQGLFRYGDLSTQTR